MRVLGDFGGGKEHCARTYCRSVEAQPLLSKIVMVLRCGARRWRLSTTDLKSPEEETLRVAMKICLT